MTDVHNRNAALPILTAQQLRGPQIHNPIKPGTDIGAVLKRTAGLLKAAYGRIDPAWGEVQRIRRGKADLPVDGGPDIFRAIYGAPDAKGRVNAMVGDSYFMLVEWDRAGQVSSRSIHQYGSATLDASSPHYADQTPLFAAMVTKPVLFTEAQLQGQIAEEYRPGERRPRPTPAR
jgi:penicillin amidase/acyl-homoserine-lactone acylase